MIMGTFSLREDYWEDFELLEADIEFLYDHLLETEIPLTPEELLLALVEERIKREMREIEQQRLSGGDIYLPKEHYTDKQDLVFPALNWRHAQVIGLRPGFNPEFGEFEVIRIQFEDGEEREFAAGFDNHKLNNPVDRGEDEIPDPESILALHQDELIKRLEQGLEAVEDFVFIAGRWFPRALLVDVHAGHLNLAEAVLDMGGGGPLPTRALLEQVELPSDVNPKLVEFSMDLALQEDERFDEVGPAGEVSWYLQRLEPEAVRKTPFHLRYQSLDYDQSLLTNSMLALVRELDDELSPAVGEDGIVDEVIISLLFPHWRSGTIPLSSRAQNLFPTAYRAPRIRFTLVDGDTGKRFSGWVVRKNLYVYGLKDWYTERGLIPGSLIRIRPSEKPGEVIIRAEVQRSRREWMRTILVGSDGGIVFAMLKQIISAAFDERMAIVIPDEELLDNVWIQQQKKNLPFERIVVNTMRELAKLNPQSHVHASELYAAVNIVRRCPPDPLLALLASRPWFVHVGDLYFRFDDSEGI